MASWLGAWLKAVLAQSLLTFQVEIILNLRRIDRIKLKN